MSEFMSVKQAKRALSRKLVFGDERQIRAVKFLEQVELCKEKIQSCNHDFHTCDCTTRFSNEVRRAALNELS